MRNSFLLLFLLFFIGCASNEFSVTLIRSARATGAMECYSVDQNGLGTKTIELPTDSESKRATFAIDRTLVAKIHGLIADSLAALVAIGMRDSGEMTTGLQIDAHNVHHEITWANTDPPKLATPVLDILYRLMLQIETQMISPK